MYGKDGRWYTTRHRSVGKKLETYRFLVRFIGEMGYSPTVREIADEMRVSTSTALSYLRDLENVGLIRREADKPRTIRIAETTVYGM